MDHGKAVYEAKQRDKASRKKSTTVQVKEMKYRPKIGVGDFDTKTRKVKQFLGEGNRVKITIMFRGREMQHPELGRKILDQVAEHADDISKIEIYPKLDGRNMVMVLVPDREKQFAVAKAADDLAKEEAASVATSAVEAEAVVPATEVAASAVEAEAVVLDIEVETSDGDTTEEE
jgi:translation initiation factor IF-3